MKDLYNLELINKFMKDNHLSKTQLAYACHLSPGTLERIFWGHKTLQVKSVLKLADFMNVSPAELFSQNKKQ